MFSYSPAKDLLAGRTFLITGASDGIGLQCAKTFAEYGSKIILLGRSQEKLEALFDEIEALYPEQTFLHPMDFKTATTEDYAQLAASCEEEFGCLDGIIHSAAILGPRAPLEHYPDADWHDVMQTNVTAPYLLTKALLPELAKSDDARVLFLSSSVGRQARAFWGAYGVSKFALEGLMQTLAEEVENTTAIRVNSLNPGGTRTNMRRDAYPAEDPNTVPTAEELMPVFLYLMSHESKQIHKAAIDCRDFEPGNYLPLT
ncbi:MAG: YciK family oxidoreductase [Pseudohongiellaceae bacterium]